MLAVAWLFFERVKHLLGSTTVTGGTMGGAALCKQALIAKPLSGLCVGFCVVFFITATHYVTRCSLAIFFYATRLHETFLPCQSALCPLPFFFFMKFTHPAPFFSCFSSSQVFFAILQPPPAVLSLPSSLFHALFLIPPPLSFAALPPSHRRLIG